MYESIPDNVMDEIVAGAGGQVEDKAETAISFLNEWSGYIVAFIEIIFENSALASSWVCVISS